jgi:hypothetical protein
VVAIHEVLVHFDIKMNVRYMANAVGRNDKGGTLSMNKGK